MKIEKDQIGIAISMVGLLGAAIGFLISVEFSKVIGPKVMLVFMFVGLAGIAWNLIVVLTKKSK